jgi:ABC-2 type transport system permease protein
MKPWLRKLIALAEVNVRFILRDPAPVVIVVAMPLLYCSFTKSLFEAAAQGTGGVRRTGADLAVPRAAIMFAFFTLFFVGLNIHREHAWRTWSRLASVTPSRLLILLGKCVPYFVLVVLQQLIAIGFGFVVLGLRVRGSWLGVIAIALAFGFAVVAMGAALAAVCRSIHQVSAFGNLGAILMAGAGGVFAVSTPRTGLGGAIARATPTFWAADGYERVLVGGQGVDALGRHVLALCLVGVVASCIAVWRFDVDEGKVPLL